MRKERLATTTPALDAAETAWWERFSETCERVWALDEETATCLRGPYLRDAARYLTGAGDGEGPATIIDLGCGSGFTTRLVAGPRTRVIGIDVSPRQIALAERAAQDHPHSEMMEFRVASAAELLAEGGRFDGVMAHAFLHHLAADELRDLLDELAGALTPGGRAWFLEPVFYAPGRSTAATRLKQAEAFLSFGSRRLFSALGLLDEGPLTATERFMAEAEANGYFL